MPKNGKKAKADMSKRVRITMVGATIGASLFATFACATAPNQPAVSSAKQRKAFDHSLWDAALKAHVDDRGLVDYAGIKKSNSFSRYLRQLETTPAGSLTGTSERLAYWINAYNALTIHAVLQTLPGDQKTWRSYRIIDQKIKGKSIWKGLKFEVGGGCWTLDDIEHGILRKEDGLRDPRIHVALVCAARGCPPLWNRAYLAGEIDKQLSAAMKRFVANPKQCRIAKGDRIIEISKVFEWYGSDFVDKLFAPRAKSIPAFLAEYVDDKRTARSLKRKDWTIKYLEYDWTLNIRN